MSRLHSTLLDRNRPLWELHLIEGLQNRQFAVYTKTHHAAVDGARSVHLARSMLSSNPEDRLYDSPFSKAAGERYREVLAREHPLDLSNEELHNVAGILKARLDTGVNIYAALKTLSATWMGRGGALTLPFRDVPRSSINTSVDGARRFVAQSWPFARIRAVGKAFDSSFNDAVLAMCSGALRHYLLNHAELPQQSLKAIVPVSLRREGDIDSANAVASINADLATNIKDPVKRIAAIRASTLAGKEFLQAMSPAESQVFSTALQVPGVLMASLGLASRLPAFNTVISNVPGIRQPMFFNGAHLDGSYPVSIVTEGMALNITLVSYDKQVDFGIIACRRSLPHAQRLIDYMEQSLLELELAAGLVKPKVKAAPAKNKAVATRPAPAKKKKAARAKRAIASKSSK